MEVLISVIVPIYNAEKTLSQCVDSIIGQTYQNIEIILVDDGSSDQSAGLCDEYVQKDKRVCVIHQSNGGVSMARNIGLDLARGEYICFVDSDDFIDRDYINSLLSFGLFDCMAGGLRFCGSYSGEIVKEKRLYTFEEGNMGWGLLQNLEDFSFMCVHCKLLSRHIIEDNRLRFNTKLKLSEDNDFLFRYFLYCRNFIVLPEAKYNYRCTVDSGMKYQYDCEDALYLIHTIMLRYESLCQKYHFYNESLVWLLLKNYCGAFMHYSFSHSSDKSNFVKFVKDPYVKKYLWLRRNDSRWAQILYFLSRMKWNNFIYYLCRRVKRF